MHARLLREFSRRTIEALRAALPMRVALPALEPFLAENVEKEIRKDTMVIRRAAECLAAGAPPGPADASALLGAARAIDREFLRRVGAFPVRIEVPYERIEPLRRQRMLLGLEAAYRILDAWRHRRRLRAAFPRGELAAMVHRMLRLYAEETQALSDAVRVPGLLGPLRRRMAGRLREAMLHAASSLAHAAAAAEQKG